MRIPMMVALAAVTATASGDAGVALYDNIGVNGSPIGTTCIFKWGQSNGVNLATENTKDAKAFRLCGCW